MAKAKTITRFVYIMELRLPWYDLRRWWRLIFSFKRHVKIGIANDAEARRMTVDRAFKGYSVEIINKYYCPSASRHERYLHKLFADDHEPVSGDGGTECYLLTSSQLTTAKKYLLKQATKHKRQESIISTIIFLIICMIALFIYAKFY